MYEPEDLGRLICSECKKVRIKTPSGAACPEHGKIAIGVTYLELRQASRWQAFVRLEVAEKHETGRKAFYTVEGDDRKFKRTRMSSADIIARRGYKRIGLQAISDE